MPRHSPAPLWFFRSAKVMVTYTAALVVAGAAPPAAAARRQIATRASPRRRSLDRRSGHAAVGLGADRGPRIASRTSRPSGSRRSRYTAIPSSSTLWDKDTVFELLCAALELPLAPVGGDDLLPQRPDLSRPVVGGDLEEPRPHRLHRFIA